MERAKERPAQKDAAPREAGPLDPPRTSDVRVTVHRCPFCHDDVGAADSAVCSDCLARHHAGCWAESGRCGACGGARRLRPEPLTLATAVKLLEGHGYGADEIRALLAGGAPRPAEGSVVVRRVVVPALLFIMSSLLVGGPLTLLAAEVFSYQPEQKPAIILAMLIGLVTGLVSAAWALRRS